MAKTRDSLTNPDHDEKVIWVGTPSQYINLVAYILCGLTAFLVVPLVYGVYLWLDTMYTNFEITTERVLMRKGILWRRLDDLELYRVKDIALLEPLLLRFFSLSNIELITSDPTYPDVVIQGVENGMKLRETLRKLILKAREKKGVREIDYYQDKSSYIK